MWVAEKMAFPPIAVAIQRLACMITKWTVECDRRLQRLMQYIHTNSN